MVHYLHGMNSIENLVVKLVIFATLLMIAIQIGMTNDKVRRVLSYTERIEGIPLARAFSGERAVSTPGTDGDPRSVASPIRSMGTVSLELDGVESLGQARVLVNGYPVADFYLTNAICRASPTMQRCSAEITHGETLAEAAE